MSTYTLRDTFNGYNLSHRHTLAGAAKAQAKHQNAVRRANGPTAYLTYAVLCDGRPLTDDEYDEYADALLAAQN